jgi:hypothetical protein
MPLPDPWREIRLLSVRTLRGANYWSLGAVTRADLVPGAYDEIPSDRIPGFTDALVHALPGLWEHRCSVGERGGFVQRLREGTYAPHVVEHLALELQDAIGHRVGYGRARGGDRDGEYTVVVEHRHGAVGARALALAVDAVRHACAGTLRGLDEARAELAALSATADVPGPDARIACGIIGDAGAEAVRRELLARSGLPDEAVVAVPEAALLETGLPYRESRTAVVLGAAPEAVPARYREEDRGASLVAVLADVVAQGGVVVTEAREWEVQALARHAGCRVWTFTATEGEEHLDFLCERSAVVRGGHVVVDGVEAGALDPRRPPEVQLAAALALRALEEGDVDGGRR